MNHLRLALAQRLGLGLAMAVWAAEAGAAPITFLLYQAGFEEGAVLSGEFVAEDIDGNGYIVGGPGYVPKEVLSFSLSFSGNSLVPAFDASAGLETLVYVLGSGAFANGIIPGSDAFDGLTSAENFADGYYDVQTGLSNIDCVAQGIACTVIGFGGAFPGGYAEHVTSSKELMTVTEVPLVPAGTFLLGGLAALGAARRKRAAPWKH